MKSCPKCNKEFEETQSYCSNDGAELILKETKSGSINFGDKAIVSGDINISNTSAIESQYQSSKDQQSDTINFGDKNIVSGDINVSNRTEIGEQHIHQDDTKITKNDERTREI